MSLVVGVYYDILWRCLFSCKKNKKKLLFVSIRELFKLDSHQTNLLWYYIKMY